VKDPTVAPTLSPSSVEAPTLSPTLSPSIAEDPTESPTLSPSLVEDPTVAPTLSPTLSPSLTVSVRGLNVTFFYSVLPTNHLSLCCKFWQPNLSPGE
jgi:hypothetical protein